MVPEKTLSPRQFENLDGSQRALLRALGYSLPDTGACDESERESEIGESAETAPQSNQPDITGRPR